MRLGLGIDLATRRCGVAAAAAATIRDNITTGATVYEARISEAQTNTCALFTIAQNEWLGSSDPIFDIGATEMVSLSIWVRADDWSVDTDNNAFIMMEASNNFPADGYGIYYNTSADAFQYYIEDSDTQLTGAIGAALNDTWHHVVLTIDRTGGINLLNAYLDGTKTVTDLDISGITDVIATHDFTIGGFRTQVEGTFNACAAGFWKGTALDQTAVTALYNAGTPLTAAQVAADGDIPAATAYWNLDELSGTRADSVASYDLTDNNTVASAAGPTGWYHQAATGHVIGRIPLYNLADTLVDYLTDAGTHANRAVFDLDDAAANNEASIDASAGGSSYDYVFGATLAQPFYNFSVVKADSADVTLYVYHSDTGSGTLLGHNSTGAKMRIHGGTTTLASDTDHDTTLRLWTSLLDDSNSAIWLDGTADGGPGTSIGTTGLTGVTILSKNNQARPWGGKLMEFWLISAVKVGGRAAIDTLLKTKFGI